MALLALSACRDARTVSPSLIPECRFHTFVWPHGQLDPPAAWNDLEAGAEDGWNSCIARAGGRERRNETLSTEIPPKSARADAGGKMGSWFCSLKPETMNVEEGMFTKSHDHYCYKEGETM